MGSLAQKGTVWIQLDKDGYSGIQPRTFTFIRTSLILELVNHLARLALVQFFNIGTC